MNFKMMSLFLPLLFSQAALAGNEGGGGADGVTMSEVISGNLVDAGVTSVARKSLQLMEVKNVTCITNPWNDAYPICEATDSVTGRTVNFNFAKFYDDENRFDQNSLFSFEKLRCSFGDLETYVGTSSAMCEGKLNNRWLNLDPFDSNCYLNPKKGNEFICQSHRKNQKVSCDLTSYPDLKMGRLFIFGKGYTPEGPAIAYFENESGFVPCRWVKKQQR